MPPSETLLTAGGIGGRTEPTMRGQIDKSAKLIGQGKLRVTGWANYDDDERGAVVHVTVTQGGSTGDSDSEFSNEENWVAMVTGGFKPGVADAEATATVTNDDGTEEPYPEPGDDPWARVITIT